MDPTRHTIDLYSRCSHGLFYEDIIIFYSDPPDAAPPDAAPPTTPFPRRHITPRARWGLGPCPPSHSLDPMAAIFLTRKAAQRKARTEPSSRALSSASTLVSSPVSTRTSSPASSLASPDSDSDSGSEHALYFEKLFAPLDRVGGDGSSTRLMSFVCGVPDRLSCRRGSESSVELSPTTPRRPLQSPPLERDVELRKDSGEGGDSSLD
ncbi:hypothetical protein MMC13_005760 [Lambiella insularis]|nr:hypothetical protein [Lambiella insularis]